MGRTVVHISDLEARNAEVKDTTYRIKDDPGLYLEINPNGSKIWRLRYRNPQTKKETMFTIGSFPDVKCAEARLTAAQAKVQVRDGIDPNTKKQRDRLRGSGKTFQEIALEWHENQLEAVWQKLKRIWQGLFSAWQSAPCSLPCR